MIHFPAERADPTLLLLSGCADWSRATDAATASLGLHAPHTIEHPGEAVALLSAGLRFSHLLVHGPTAGALLPDLIGMTAGEAESGTAAVLLGLDGAAARHAARAGRVTVVPRVSEGWLAQALAAAALPVMEPDALPLDDLLGALADGRIEVRYQPVVRIADGTPLGIEALARLDHPVLGTLAPDRFVPQLEAAGYGSELAAAVIGRAFAEWRGDRLRRLGLKLGVNLPVDVLSRPRTADRLETWREAAGIPPDRIVVELTETRPVDDPSALAAVLARLRAVGYGLAMDDVGPGLRQYEDLIGMTFTAMKLDKELMQDTDGAVARAFLDRAIAAAHSAGLLVVAEGVEDSRTRARMAARGVDAAQGFRLGRPLPAAAVPIWLADRSCRRVA
jgi:EAL domain-containing protein (putative c-di-GMP-specific phosphodiesterase class I)